MIVHLPYYIVICLTDVNMLNTIVIDHKNYPYLPVATRARFWDNNGFLYTLIIYQS